MVVIYSAKCAKWLKRKMKSPSIDVCEDQVLRAGGVDGVIDAVRLSLRWKASVCMHFAVVTNLSQTAELMMPLRLLSVTTEVSAAATATNDSVGLLATRRSSSRSTVNTGTVPF